MLNPTRTPPPHEPSPFLGSATGPARTTLAPALRRGDRDAQRLHPTFEALYAEVRADYFSRDPAKWPVFEDPGFRALTDFRRRHLSPDARVAAYPRGPDLLETLRGTREVPHGRRRPDGGQDELMAFAAALSKDWENPASVENVITMPCDPALYGAMLGTLANPNLVYSEYAGLADQLEKHVVRKVASLVGYDPERATGLFSQGGTFCNLYGYLLGIRKSLPQTRAGGMNVAPDFRVFNSQGGHYSNITNLSLLGVDIKERTLRLRVTDANCIDLSDFEARLRACFAVGCRVPAVMLTMGTTDTFALDDVAGVRAIRDRLCEEFGVAVKPHIHVDSAIGWTMLFFVGYDFERNPLCINEATLEGIERCTARVRGLREADSFTVDFQKWGYVPYTSSLLMVREGADMASLSHDQENFSYFERHLETQTHLRSTIECSRGAPGVFGAYAALEYLGIDGYRITLAHCLQNASYFRHRLEGLGRVKVMAPENQGPSVGFRIYGDRPGIDPDEEFELEKRCLETPEAAARLERNSRWHRRCFLERGKVGLYTNWVEFIARSNYGPRGQLARIPGEKAVFINPLTRRRDIDTFVDGIFRCGSEPSR